MGASRNATFTWCFLAICLCAPPAAVRASAIEIDSPTLSPAFRPAGRDYVVSCSSPVSLQVRVSNGTRARIAKNPSSMKSQSAELALKPGQAVRVHVRRRDRERRTYSIRCLPEDFPGYTFTRLRKPSADLYLVTPGSTGPDAPFGGYAAVFTNRGAPIWWLRDVPSPFDAKVLADGTFAWTRFQGGIGTDPAGSYVLRNADGQQTGEVRAVGSPTDEHDLEVAADGNYLVLSYRERDGVDTSAYNGNGDASIYDAVVQEVTPTGELVSEWSSQGHIGLDETPPSRWARLTNEPYDTNHINSVDPLPNGDFLISLRHTDAVYRVDGETGAVKWKLGGTPTPQSLEVHGDAVGYPLAAQHDARWLGHGEISVHDNGDGGGRGPRVVRYRIEDGVAHFVDAIADPLATSSPCCGSARPVGDNWLISWGGVPLVTEFGPDHQRTFSLAFGGTGSSYRAVSIDGKLDATELRQGMDAQAREEFADGE